MRLSQLRQPLRLPVNEGWKDAGALAFGSAALAGSLYFGKDQSDPIHPVAPSTTTAQIQQPKPDWTQKLIAQKQRRDPEGIEQPIKIDLMSIAQIESGGNPRAVNRKTGARGLYQFLPQTWAAETKKEFGKAKSFNDAFDPQISKLIAQKYLNVTIPRMLKGYNIPVNTYTILAAYNWGVGNLAGIVMKFGDKWVEHLPRETQLYLRKYEVLN
jgi:hypothetical protein